MFMAPSQVFENKFKARHSDAVAQRPVTGRICCPGDRCPIVREPLEPLTLNGHQPADVQTRLYRIEDDICGAFALPGALSGGHRADLIVVASLLRKKLTDTMLICSSKGISNFRRISRSIPTVFWFAPNCVCRNCIRTYQRGIIAAGPIPGCHRRYNRERPGITAVNPMVFIQYKRLMSMFLCPQRPCKLSLAVHDTSSLISQAENRRHTVSAL